MKFSFGYIWLETLKLNTDLCLEIDFFLFLTENENDTIPRSHSIRYGKIENIFKLYICKKRAITFDKMMI